MFQTTLLRSSLILAGILALTGNAVRAQHSDIAVYQNSDGQLTTHDDGGGQPERFFFQRDFDLWGPFYAGDDPGFQMSGLNPPAGYSSLPGQSTLDLSVVPVHFAGVGASNLLFWDGVGPMVDFQAPPASHVLFLDDAANTEISLNGSTSRFDDLIAGVTDTNGGLHEHLTFGVENGGAAPNAGFYLMGWQLGMDGLDSSKLVVAVVSTPSIPSSIEDQVTQWLSTREITIAGDFDADGEHALPDVDALVAAIVAGTNDLAFDLNGDGPTDSQDLALWLELAGAVLNPSGNPFLLGDANLDGAVDGSDFLIWNDNKFSAAAAWSSGDFNADGFVDGSDFLIWNDQKFQSADRSPKSVPEPNGMLAIVLLLLASGPARARNLNFITSNEPEPRGRE